MKRYTYILTMVVGLVAFAFTSCAREITEVYNDAKFARLTIDVRSAASATRADNTFPYPESYTIKSLRVFVLDEIGNIEKNEFVNNPDALGTGSMYYSVDVVQSSEKKIYVLVNEPTDLSATLDSFDSEYELTSLDYQIAEAENNKKFLAGESIQDVNRLIPMSAIAYVDANADVHVKVKVDRILARVDVMVDKDDVALAQNVEFNSNTKISASGLYYNSTLFYQTVPPTPSHDELLTIDTLAKSVNLAVRTDDRKSSKRLLSFYVATRTYNPETENRIAINIDNITVDGVSKEINSTIVIGENVNPVLSQIDRNYIYRIFATYKGEEASLEVTGEYFIEDWTIEEVDGDIEGVLISAQNEIVMDWFTLGERFTAKNVAFGSNRSVDIYIPTSFDEASGKYTFVKCAFSGQTGASYDLRDLSDYGIYDEDNFLLQIEWLTEAKIFFDSALTGHFQFTYCLADAPHHLDRVPIQLHSANVRKNIYVIYDNGFVPGDLLVLNEAVEGTWVGIPNGIVFAKRGYALHPLQEKEIILPNSAGLYEGDATMSATEADKYCKEQLGPKWYAPNKAQLADIQRNVLELGTSYRLNNVSDSYYWSSELDSGSNYWAIDFAKPKSFVEPELVSAPFATQYFVRCIANL